MRAAAAGKGALTSQMANRTRSGGNGRLAARIEEEALRDERHAQVLLELLEAMPSPSDQATIVAETFEPNERAGNERA